MRRNQYSSEKRRKELDRKKKQEEKRQKKLERKNLPLDGAIEGTPGSEGAAQGVAEGAPLPEEGQTPDAGAPEDSVEGTQQGPTEGEKPHA